MAAQRITCPDCKSVLKPAKPVPDGKKVKCPKCGNMFTTPGLVEEDDDRPRKKSAGKAEGKVAVKKAAPKAPDPFDEPNEDGGIYSPIQEEEKSKEDKPQIEYAPDMSIKDLRGPAQAAVVRPSNYLLLIGGISCLCDILVICIMFWPMVFSDSVVDWRKVVQDYYKSKQDKSSIDKFNDPKLERKDLKDKDNDIVEDAETEERIVRFVYMGIFIFILIYNAVACVGAVKMQNLESRGWGIASSIMTLLPMGCGGISYLIYFAFSRTIGKWLLDELGDYYAMGLGALPYLAALLVGVWSLRTLMSQEVIDGYEYVAE